MKKKRKVIKSSVDGRFASKEDLETKPAETYRQTVEVKEKKTELETEFDKWNAEVSGEVQGE